MEFEHIALNVADSRAMADWYVKHLNMRVVFAMDAAPYMCFVADEKGRVVMELYSLDDCPVPDYAQQNSLMFHVAFTDADPGAVKDRLVGAGATVESDNARPDGSRMIMLRDPWGLALQLVKRAKPLV